MLGDKTNANGLREYLVVYGNARVTEGGAVDLLQAPGADFIWGPELTIRRPPCATFRVTSPELRRDASPASGRGLRKAAE